MATLCRPAVAVPEHVVTVEQTLDLVRARHADHPQLPRVLRLIEDAGVRTRHLVRPVERTPRHPDPADRPAQYAREARRHLPEVVERALEHAELSAREIDLLVWVSGTGAAVPPPTAWMINTLGFRTDTRQLPIAQPGGAAGAAAINRAHDFCRAYPGANALVVACEFCSLRDRPSDADVGSLLSDGLFGDAVAAAVVRGRGGTGVRIERTGSHLLPGTEDWVSPDGRDTGFPLLLDERVPGAMERFAPALRTLATEHGRDASGLGFCIVHVGGPRVLDELCRHLTLDPAVFRFSRATLAERGNTAGAVLLDALARLFDDGGPTGGTTGLIAGLGPGLTAEIALGRRVDATVERTVPRRPVAINPADLTLAHAVAPLLRPAGTTISE